MSRAETTVPGAEIRPRSPLERLSRATLLKGLNGIERGSLTVRAPDGSEHRFGGREAGPEAVIDVRDPRFFQRMLVDGELGAGESYIRGEWRADSLMDVVRLGILNRRHLKRGSPLFWLGAIGAWALHQTRSNTQGRARENIQAHYDLGNDFFSLFLDPSMTYSCAYFDRAFLDAEHPDTSPLFETRGAHPEDRRRTAADGAEEARVLEAAQVEKYRRIARKAGLAEGQHVLEIGCGWGGFAEIAAREFGCRVTGVTISNEQAAYARERMRTAGLADRVTIEIVDYRKLTGRFDHIVSIEMLEAVGHRFLPTYFGQIDALLSPGGRAVIQVITIPDRRYWRYRLRPDYIQKYIFPGAHLPSMRAMKRALRGTQVWIVDQEDLAEHYGPTLAMWRRRLLGERGAVRRQGFDDAFVRRWEFYFAYCEAAFRTNYVADWQLVLEKGAPST